MQEEKRGEERTGVCGALGQSQEGVQRQRQTCMQPRTERLPVGVLLAAGELNEAQDDNDLPDGLGALLVHLLEGSQGAGVVEDFVPVFGF